MPLVVFEGAEGCGKSTQLDLLAKALRDRGLTVHCTREPGGTPLAEHLREVFKTVPGGDTPTVLTELLTIMAARSQHTARVLNALPRDHWVLCDRYLDSSYVYQGILGGLPKSYIDSVADPVVGSLLPDLTLVYLAPGSILHQRLAKRIPLAPDRFDGSPVPRLDAMNASYDRLCREAWPYPRGAVPSRVPIDATPAPQDVFCRTWEAVETKLLPSFKGDTIP